ncbi:hypothetical protein AB1Y20_014973 [Prymnesium parvum]|uniref:Gfo/Idh/MocA-like oxidoreductase N-terminal domain-containing protein n=1 Tax=Prymnesium parvum TaxID=97485 RepID=A0AB34JZA3_PRYPA
MPMPMPSQTLPNESPRTKLDTILVCCGQPKLSMGWFHLMQLLDEPHVNVRAVVEPFFLGPGKDTPGAAAFNEMRQSLKDTHPDLTFYASAADLPIRSGDAPLLALIAGRTCDAPRLFTQLVEKGATHIYIEKPGAENAAQLAAMRELAARRDVRVVVGYNKNVAKYVRDGLARMRKVVGAGEPAPQVTLEHCNEFAPGAELLSFLRGPGAEGMLHNMCCHELALAVSLFGVSTSRLVRVSVARDKTELVDLGEGKSDFSKVAFCLELTPDEGPPRPGGASVSQLHFAADRCGGNFSRLTLRFANALAEKEASFCLPDAEHKLWVAEAQAADPEIRPYFLQQAPDYKTLKHTFIEHILAEKPGIPDGVVGLEDAEGALRLADMLVPILKYCVTTGNDWTPS